MSMAGCDSSSPPGVLFNATRLLIGSWPVLAESNSAGPYRAILPYHCDVFFLCPAQGCGL